MKEYSTYIQREKLINKLPLETPMGLHICPSTYCNFKCHYCKHSMDTAEKNGVGSTGWLKREFMEMDLFEKIIFQLKEFPNKLKVLNFAWLGEPLLHPEISKMVRIAKEAEVAETISLVTNGSMLTHKLSLELIDAGIDRVRISLQGLNEEDYWNISKYNLNFTEFVNNIEFLYKNKQNTKIYIKIMDAMLKSKEDEKYFQDIFQDKCDMLNIEHLVPLHNELDINDMKDNFDIGYFGNKIVENKICSYCFYTMAIAPDGKLMPCFCSDSVLDSEGVEHTMARGSLHNETLTEFWNGKEISEIRKNMIEGRRNENPVCNQCAYVKYHTAEEDRLDGYENLLKKLYC